MAFYLVARFYDSSEEAIENASRLVEMAPDYPWGHLALAAALRSAGRQEAKPEVGARADDHLTTFMRLCPSRFQEPLSTHRRGGDRDLFQPHLSRYREALASSPEVTRLGYLPSLWRQEFKASPPDRHDEVRNRVRRDLMSIAALDRKDDARWWTVLLEGYEMTGDDAESGRLTEELIEAFPCHPRAVKARHDQLVELYGARSSAEGLSQQKLRDVHSTASNWVAACPHEFSFRLIRFAAAKQMDDLSEDEIAAEIDYLLEIWADNQRTYGMYHGPNHQAAELLLKRDLHLERIPRLLKDEMRYHGERWERQPLDDLPESMRDMERSSREMIGIENELLLAEAYLKLGRKGKAERILDECGKRLDEIGQSDGPFPGRLESRQARLWGLRGELAENENRPLDAFACYRRAARLEPDGGWNQDATDLWFELGGSEEGLTALISASEPDDETSDAAADVSPWEAAEAPLIPFELTDLSGRTWSPSDLAGGAVLINVWSTWCAPCRMELPHLQNLHERIEDRENARVVSLNVDYNPGLVAPFVERLGLTFPVLFGEEYFYDRTPAGALGIPQNWIVDADGIIRWKSTGFPADQGEEWLVEALELLDQVASGSLPPPENVPE
jgi:thiol-disulfide isomerase/thioredoxin